MEMKASRAFSTFVWKMMQQEKKGFKFLWIVAYIENWKTKRHRFEWQEKKLPENNLMFLLM